MKLSKLVEHIEYELVQGSLDTEVADIAYDSRKIKEGMLFVAMQERLSMVINTFRML